MSNWFDRDAPDPMRAAHKGMRPDMPKRFWREAGVIERDGQFALSLDGRTAKTPAKKLLAVPTRSLAEALAAEWDTQADRLDPATMPMTRLVNAVIDGVMAEPAAVASEIARYAGSDALCYRAREPEVLASRQREAWNPVLEWVEKRFDAPFLTTEGILHIAQPPSSLAAVEAALQSEDPYRLAALHVMTTLTGSVLLAFAVRHGQLEAEAAWAAAHIDEDFEIELWGEDEEAQTRRAFRWRDMEAAARLMVLVQ